MALVDIGYCVCPSETVSVGVALLGGSGRAGARALAGGAGSYMNERGSKCAVVPLLLLPPLRAWSGEGALRLQTKPRGPSSALPPALRARRATPPLPCQRCSSPWCRPSSTSPSARSASPSAPGWDAYTGGKDADRATFHIRDFVRCSPVPAYMPGGLVGRTSAFPTGGLASKYRCGRFCLGR